jgi:hypothetical protein
MWQSIASEERATDATREMHRATKLARMLALLERADPDLPIVMCELSLWHMIKMGLPASGRASLAERVGP